MRCAGLGVLIDGPDYSACRAAYPNRQSSHSNIQHPVTHYFLPRILSVQSKSQKCRRWRVCMCKITQFQMHFGALGGRQVPRNLHICNQFLAPPPAERQIWAVWYGIHIGDCHYGWGSIAGGGSISRNIITDVARWRGNGVASKVPDVKMLWEHIDALKRSYGGKNALLPLQMPYSIRSANLTCHKLCNQIRQNLKVSSKV